MGLFPILAHIIGLEAALEHAEERTYDTVVQIIDSEEVDRAVRDVINSVFSRMTSELGKKSWNVGESSISALSTIGFICRIGWSSGINWSAVIRVSIVT